MRQYFIDQLVAVILYNVAISAVLSKEQVEEMYKIGRSLGFSTILSVQQADNVLEQLSTDTEYFVRTKLVVLPNDTIHVIVSKVSKKHWKETFADISTNRKYR